MAKVSLKNVSKSYPGKKAVGEVSLEIRDGELVALTGPPDCGKSTLLRLIAGLQPVSSGEVFVGERSVNDVPAKDRDIAMVFGTGGLYPLLSIHDNLAFALRVRKFSQAEIKKRVLAAAQILGIENLLDRKAETLSAKQEQRVAIGRAIARNPKVFLFDDPLSRLDPSDRVSLRLEIAKLHQRIQATIIYATSNAIEAMALASRLVVMNNGVVEQDDSPVKIYHEPANLFVAGFCGNPPMNFLNGTLRESRDALVFSEREDGAIQVRLPVSDRPAAREFIGQPIVLGIRPEDVAVGEVDNTRAQPAERFPALVEAVERAGSETHIYLQTGAHTVISRTVRPADGADPGHRVQFEMNLKKAHLFDPASSRRIA